MATQRTSQDEESYPSPQGDSTESSDTVVALDVAQPLASASWRDTWTHVGFPAFFGVTIGALWQWQVQPHLPWGFPNPVQGTLLLAILLSPLLHRLLTDYEMSRWTEYAMGQAALGGSLILIWFMGYGGLVCGGYLALTVWIWLSTSWWRFHLPPFRSALWHVLGMNIGALGGSILAYQWLL